ncbi:beta-hexosaminidase-like [Physella acuta]|uniref:beta-hexosaminidase-like n=1 Tax=Physella acuta TaxID=109671 RepID=UPI0027DB18D0|nr:beta-hexosaminidase-like [Physella acuta]
MAGTEHSGRMLITQEDLDLVASTLDVKYQVEDNLSGGRALYSSSITLTNQCNVQLSHAIEHKEWSIYFSHLRMVEPSYLPADSSVNLEYAGISFSHLNGCIFKLSPLRSFKTLGNGDTVSFKFNAQHYSASRTDILPNWYIHVEGLEPRIIKCTEGESLSFVGPFTSPKQYKRFDYVLPSGKRRFDIYQPFTPELRFSRYPEVKKETEHLKFVIPTPAYFKKGEGRVDVTCGDWSIVTIDDVFSCEAVFLSEKMKLPVTQESAKLVASPRHSIILRKNQVKPVLEGAPDHEAYEVEVDPSNESVQISANTSAGVFYGIQSLLSLASESGIVPACHIQDVPRYPYRGMHVDVSRNFHTKEEILALLDTMAMYKLNKFHFHLTDDEGWRLEIPGLEELTQVGSRRGHDPTENSCLLPLLGSGPFPEGLGCGFFTVEDYRDILRYANTRHIEVIPEIDMPGHSHAAIRAMRVRYDKLKSQNNEKEAERYLLTDPNETSHSFSVQMMAENSMNPGLESTFTFVDKVISELKAMHQDIQPLRVFHMGGDEVPFEAWDDSPACRALVDTKKVAALEDLMEYFVTRVGRIAHQHGLELGAWQDGIVVKSVGPYSRSKFPNNNVLVHFWRNVWESGQAYDAHKLANEGYEVILAPGTHLYFDHPYEPDPEERGLYWACRYLDTHKVFRFVPENLMFNADVKLTGEKITKLDLQLLRESEDFTELKKPKNITGIQGQIWTELVRTADQFYEMIFPRLIALAERAWHKAPWEDVDPKKRKPKEEEDWSVFAHTLGNKELKRLEAANISYHIPPPGARVSGDGLLELRSCYPGQPMSYSVDKGQIWKPYLQMVDVVAYDEVLARVSSHNGCHHSRVISIPIQVYPASDDQNN